MPFRQASLQPRFLGAKAYPEIAILVASAIEGETQKIDRLRAFPSSLDGMGLRIATEFNEFGLGRCQGKSEPLSVNME